MCLASLFLSIASSAIVSAMQLSVQTNRWKSVAVTVRSIKPSRIK
ncbi:hypothetical protein BAZMOX_04566_4 [methanotrophic endosymbiont of Bathymodiolus azoricus (Menez Gwen)]|nr:hypothetical protein BAZMOX_04566_4 [methanotrophic endosymbiont of Bathymodiolus azoricus (Menez Gwen)]